MPEMGRRAAKYNAFRSAARGKNSAVIPGRAEGAIPESTRRVGCLQDRATTLFEPNCCPWLWFPGSPLRGAPE